MPKRGWVISRMFEAIIKHNIKIYFKIKNASIRMSDAMGFLPKIIKLVVFFMGSCQKSWRGCRSLRNKRKHLWHRIKRPKDLRMKDNYVHKCHQLDHSKDIVSKDRCYSLALFLFFDLLRRGCESFLTTRKVSTAKPAVIYQSGGFFNLSCVWSSENNLYQRKVFFSYTSSSTLYPLERVSK